MDDKNHKLFGRRGFLGGVLAVGGAAGLGVGGWSALARLAQGQDGTAPPDRFYVFAYFQGGWDTLLGIDPRDPAVFSEDSVGVTRIMPGYGNQSTAEFQAAPAYAPGTEILLGPAARPLDAVADRLTVVRGMSMDTLTHEVGRRRFITGKPPSGLNARGSAGTAWLASRWGGQRLIPNLSVRVESFNPDLSPEFSALRVGSSADLVAMLRRRDPIPEDAVDQAINDLHTDEASCARALGSPMLRGAESARQRMRAVLDADVQSLFDFGNATDPTMMALRDRYGFATNQLTTPGAQAAVAYQALANGVSRAVSFTATDSLDTHFDDWEDDQAPRQRTGWKAIADLAAHLAETPYEGGESMLDRTYIVAFSEFMRTPLLNARGGRDHWLTNSCAIVGGKARSGGRVIGAASDVGMSPQLVDLATGRVTDDPTGSIIYPEHVLRSMLVDAGLEEDRADLRVPAIPGLLST